MTRSLAILLIVSCTAVLGAASPRPLRAENAPKKPATIKDLEGQQVDISKDPPQGVDTSKTMDSYRRFLDLNAGDAALRSEALRRLGDLNLESSESERIERELGWKPQFQDLRMMIASSWRWLQNHPHGFKGSSALLGSSS